MKKSNVDIQSENALLLALAIADGYFPMSQKEYNTKLKNRMLNSGTSDYKKSYEFAIAGMPEYALRNAIICGRLTLANKEDKYLSMMIGNNEQFETEFDNVSKFLIEDYNQKHNINIDSDSASQNKFTLYKYFEENVVPNLITAKEEYLSDNSVKNIYSEILSRDLIGALFEYKFDAFNLFDYCHTKRDKTYYALAHGEIDAVLDVYDSLKHGYDKLDMDLRAISPHTIDFDRDNRR